MLQIYWGTRDLFSAFFYVFFRLKGLKKGVFLLPRRENTLDIEGVIVYYSSAFSAI